VGARSRGIGHPVDRAIPGAASRGPLSRGPVHRLPLPAPPPGLCGFHFDFIGSDDDLAAVRSRVLDRWSRVPGAPDSARDEATLVAPDGTIRAARFDALVKRRNDAQVDLKE